MGRPDIAQFKMSGDVLSAVDFDGNFTGSSKKVGGLEVNDNTDAEALWTNRKVLEEMEDLANAIGFSSIDEATNSIQLAGIITVQYGKIPLTGITEAQATFGKPFKTKVLFDGYSVETSDSTFVCHKLLGSVSNTGISYGFNQAGVDGTLTWFAVGI